MRVVLVHWNQPKRLADTVAAFRASDGIDVRITVVDNDSGPEARKAAESLDGVDEVVASGGNLGYGGGANVGFARFLADADDGEYVAIAPHDALPAPDCLARIVAELDARPDAGLACADYGDGLTPVVDPYFGGIPAPLTVTDGWEPAGYPHGTLFVARRGCLEDIGTFDERYFSYCEEADLGVRARRAGWDVGLVRGAMVRNPQLHGALPAVSYLQLRNTLLLVRETSGCYHASIRLGLAAVQLGIGLVSPARRDPYWHVEGKVRGMADFVRGRFGPPPADLLVHPSN
jgi:cellulose synthase/poly-beta-1,6-N-acetylglucosamine synthase-like glycosyltransferase